MITTGTRVQTRNGEFGHVTSIDEMASGTTAMVVFEDASVTATGSARIHLDDLAETPQFTSPVHVYEGYNNRMQWVTEQVIVVGRSARSTGPRWVFTKRNGRITVRKIKGAFARVTVLEPTRRITIRKLAAQFPTVKF